MKLDTSSKEYKDNIFSNTVTKQSNTTVHGK